MSTQDTSRTLAPAGPGEVPISRRGLLRFGTVLGAAGITAWATRGATAPLAAQAAEGKKIVWSKGTIRVHLVEDGRIVRTMACVQNKGKTPNGSYAIRSYSRAISYYQGRQVDLPDFGEFYRRPGASWNIGFHAVPVWSDGPDAGKQIHEDALLGTELESEGCIRLAAADAAFLHAWAPLGTTVVVQDAAYGEESPAPIAPPVPVAPVDPAGPPEEPAPAPIAPPPCVPTRRWFWQRRTC